MDLTWSGSLKEAELVLFDAVERLFDQTGFKPEDVCPCLFQCICASTSDSFQSCLA